MRKNIKRVTLNDCQALGVAERFLQSRRQHRVFLNRDNLTPSFQHLLGQNAKSWTYLQNLATLQPCNPATFQSCVNDRLERILVNQEILPQDLVGMKAVLDAPAFDLARTRQVHFTASSTRSITLRYAHFGSAGEPVRRNSVTSFVNGQVSGWRTLPSQLSFCANCTRTV